MNEADLKLAILGCGAITEYAHLPAATGLPGVRVEALVDRDRRRAESLVERFGVKEAVTDVQQLSEPPDAVLVALPHHLHARTSRELLLQGIHVLVEKPMALRTADCDAMIDAAQTSGARLAVGLIRRFLPEVKRAKALIDAGALGRIHSFDAWEGRVFDWQVTTDSLFRRETAGGGVLMDLGVHVLDSLLFWLGDVTPRRVEDDSFGGVEAEAEVELEFAGGGCAKVELSRTRNLRNSTLIRGEHGTLEIDLVAHQVRLHTDNSTISIDAAPGEEEATPDVFQAQLKDWVEAIRQDRPPAVSGAEGRRSIALLEACYARRKPLVFPWTNPTPNPSTEELG